MHREEYIILRQKAGKETLTLLYNYFMLETGIRINPTDFYYYFSNWQMRGGDDPEIILRMLDQKYQLTFMVDIKERKILKIY